MVRSGAPAAAILVPKVWRRSWKRIERTPAALIASLNRFLNFEAAFLAGLGLLLAVASP